MVVKIGSLHSSRSSVTFTTINHDTASGTMQRIVLKFSPAFALALALAACGGNNNGNSDPDAGPDSDSGDCPEGDLGCACYVNETCNALNGDPLVCTDGICEEVSEPDPGELNAACTDDDECGTHAGDPLGCVAGICQLPSCLSGATNCPCGPMNACDSDDASCTMGTCRLDECDPGTAGCACDAGACDGELECIDGFCEVGVSGTLVVASAEARACEVLLADPTGALADLTFDATVHGALVEEGDQVSVGFYADADNAIAPSAITVVLAADTTSTFADLSVTQARCYDRLGAPISNASVTISE